MTFTGKPANAQSWAHGNLIELFLLSLLPELSGLIPQAEAERRAIEHTDQLIDIAGWKSFEAYSTRRQVLRYLEWYNRLVGPYLAPLAGLAGEKSSTAFRPKSRTASRPLKSARRPFPGR